jgi:hypothetical protein
MSDPRFYRIHMRLRRTEYNDVIADLESHPESEQNARIKKLLRLGLAAEGAGAGPIVASGPTTALAPAVAPLRKSRDDRQPVPLNKGADKFDALGMDPATFSFGAKMS